MRRILGLALLLCLCAPTFAGDEKTSIIVPPTGTDCTPSKASKLLTLKKLIFKKRPPLYQELTDDGSDGAYRGSKRALTLDPPNVNLPSMLGLEKMPLVIGKTYALEGKFTTLKSTADITSRVKTAGYQDTVYATFKGRKNKHTLVFDLRFRRKSDGGLTEAQEAELADGHFRGALNAITVGENNFLWYFMPQYIRPAYFALTSNRFSSPGEWVGQEQELMNPGNIYSFVSLSKKEFISGEFQGFDIDGNLVLKKENKTILVNTNSLDDFSIIKGDTQNLLLHEAFSDSKPIFIKTKNSKHYFAFYIESFSSNGETLKLRFIGSEKVDSSVKQSLATSATSLGVVAISFAPGIAAIATKELLKWHYKKSMFGTEQELSNIPEFKSSEQGKYTIAPSEIEKLAIEKKWVKALLGGTN